MTYKSGKRGYAPRIVGVTVLIILLFINNAAGLLTQECGDRNFIIKTSSHIVEGTVEKVESKWNEGNTSIYTYTNISIEKYVKGVSIPGNKVRIRTYGGVIGEVVQWGEDEPVFREGKKVRVYLQENNGEFSVICAEFGVEEIFTENITDIFPDERWNKTFGGARDDTAYSVQQTLDGGYILAGWTESYGAGKKDAWLIKTDASGSEQWNKTFGGKGDDGANSVQQTSDGGYILAGYTESYGAGKQDVWLVKTDTKGIELWNRTFGGTNDDEASSVQQTSDGGYILAGSTYPSGAGNDNAWLIKTNANGSKVWDRTGEGLWAQSMSSQANSVQQTRDCGYIFTGIIGGMSTWLVKTDANGNNQWNMTFGGHADWAYSVHQTSDGGYILAGKMYIPGGALAWLIKTDANGRQQWSRGFGRLSSAEFYRVETWAYSVQQTSDRGYILAGYTELYKSGTTYAYALLIKTDADGNEQWNRTLGGTTYGDAAYSVQQTKDGGYILAGNTKSYGSGGSDAWLIKVDGALTETTKAPTASPAQTLTAVSTRTQTVSSTEKIDGFEVILAITIFLTVHLARRKRKGE